MNSGSRYVVASNLWYPWFSTKVRAFCIFPLYDRPADKWRIIEHSGGGHFPALDSPKEFVEDLREFIGANWN